MDIELIKKSISDLEEKLKTIRGSLWPRNKRRRNKKTWRRNVKR